MSVVCLGGACVDRKYCAAADVQFRTSNPVRASRGFGGVARNVAENLARLEVPVSLMSVVGNDESGVALIDHAQRCGIRTQLVLRDGTYITPEYAAVVDAYGELVVGLADMSAMESLTVADVQRRWEEIRQSEWLFADCNLSAEVLSWCIARASSSGLRLAIDAVSEPKVRKLPDRIDGVDLLVLNEREAAAYLCESFERFGARPASEQTGMLRERGAGAVILTMGERGVAAASNGEVQHVPAAAKSIIDTTGGSDALCAGVLYALVRGRSLFEGARAGSIAAALTVESSATVRPDLSVALLDLHAGRMGEAWSIR
ncbi:MAG: carbohydrate kinase family protein [Candidatus Baltobacteraceae bacterium]